MGDSADVVLCCCYHR